MAGDVRTHEPRLSVDNRGAEDVVEAAMTFEPSPTKRSETMAQKLEAATQSSNTPQNGNAGVAVKYDEFGLPVRRQSPVYPYVSEQEEDPPEKGEAKEAGQMGAPKGVGAKTPRAPTDPGRIPGANGSGTESKGMMEKETAGETEESSFGFNAEARQKPLSLSKLPEQDKKQNLQRKFAEASVEHVSKSAAISEWSYQQILSTGADAKKMKTGEDGLEWQEMPAYASCDMWDDDGRLIARARVESDDEDLDGASKGYTRVNVNEDAQSATSMDENTSYLFKDTDDDEAARSPLSQMQATKELLTEGQSIAYVGVCRLAQVEMLRDLKRLKANGRSAKQLALAVEAMKMWSQKMMVRLYAHMELSPPEQMMIEQLAEHGVLPTDLTPTLMKNARVHNPMADSTTDSPLPSPAFSKGSQAPNGSKLDRNSSTGSLGSAPPPYEKHVDDLPDVRTPSQLQGSKTIDIDLRWTVLCDLFLVLIADSVYDSRSRTLLERVAKMFEVPWLDICRFEKRVTDALEIQESAEQNWSEAEHIENRQKQARNKRYMILGLATVGGGLVIGLSGGLLAPLIGAGLAAGFTTIGVAGTGTFLAGAGGTALIASSAVVSGSYIGGKAGFNRSKAVRTFEFRPLHNAKRVNLIITVAGWMNGKVDDVRLPFSTVDPIMGDILSIFWEPEMLQSMGQTINILATEALTQTVQQVLGSTILMTLMASLQLPIILTKLSYLVDNPWSVSLARAEAAGLILADALMHRNLGVRPVTLVGYSLGARVIFSCLLELCKHGAFGLVQNVYLFGSPLVTKHDEYARAVCVVAGRFVNGYATNDWILGYLFRATNGGLRRIAGLAAVDVSGVENIDVTELVNGHMDYRRSIPKIMIRMGWEVLSEEFTEIEDPDPDKHRERQQELIHELDEARKELEKQDSGAKKKGKIASFFSRSRDNAVKKKDWETYETNTEKSGPQKNYDDAVLFDVDAMRAELTKESRQTDAQMVKDAEKSMRELELNGHSALVADDLGPNAAATGGLQPVEGLRQTDSYSDIHKGDRKYTPSFGGSLRNSPRVRYERETGSLPTLFVHEDRGWGDEEFDTSEEKVKMSFEPPPSSSRPPPRSKDDGYGLFSGHSGFRSGGDGNGGVVAGGAFGYAGVEERPLPKSTYHVLSTALEKNVWLDEDELEPKGDGEMTMTFA